MNEVADNRRKGDADKDKTLLAEVFKLLGNSAYGKFIEAVERQNRTLYTCDEEEVDKHLRSAWFQDLEEIGDAYKIELRKDKIIIKNPFQVGIVVYQLAKLRMLQFYYEFLDFYFDRQDFKLIQMDTDSMYFAFSCEKLEEAVRPGYEAQFEKDKKRWLAWDKWSNREPGLFKLEKQATFGIALCSKCFYMEDRATGQAKVSSKGVNKRQNEMRANRFERAGLRGQPRHGNQPRLLHAQRRNVHVRAAQARSERILRQALGVGGRNPHRADRVPPVVV